MNVAEATVIIRAGAEDLSEVIDSLQSAMDRADNSQAAVSPALEVIRQDDLSEGWETTNQVKEEIDRLITMAKMARLLLLKSIGEESS